MPSAPAAYTLVLDWIEAQLRTGHLNVGDKLPGERHLAEQFGISRASVREAVRILDVMGLVRSATGSGPSSGAVVISEPSSALAWALLAAFQRFSGRPLTPAEREALTDRWAVVPLLAEGMSYRAIHEATGVSVTTVGRVARCVEDGAGGYLAALRHRDTLEPADG